MFESLETRRLLSTVTQVGTTLTVNGTGNADILNVRENGGNVHVEYYNAAGAFVAQDLTGITAININGLGGGDSIFYTGNSIGANIHGDSGKGKTGGSHGAGSGGSTGGSTGKAGGDFIVVTDEGTGSSVVDGDGGDDDITLVAANMTGGRTTVFGGAGNDNIYINTDNRSTYNTALAHAVIYAEAGKDVITIYDGRNTVDGGSGNDVVIESTDSVNDVTSALRTSLGGP